MFNFYKYHLGKLLIVLFMVLQFSSSNISGNNSFDRPLVGTNLSSINYYATQMPFLNEFKSSQQWLTQNKASWNTKEQNLLDVDSNGWVRSLPNDETTADYTRVSSLLFRDHGNYLSGRYVVLYEGEGNIEYKFDAKKNDALSTKGRDVIEVDPSKSGILLSITETDPNQTGDYIRNIKVIPEVYESAATTTETFNPEFINKIEPFESLRFMDWMEANNSKQEEWSDRPKKEDARYSVHGAPVEIMVELANQTDTDPWFTIPHKATDEYVSNFAQYVKNNLEPDLKVYVEYSNEVWNDQFEQNKWAREQAQKEWSNSKLGHIDWFSKRTTEVVQIWDDVFAQDSERVIGVMGAQAANTWTGKRALNYEWSDAPLSHEDTGIDAVAIAPYFGGYLGSPKNSAQVESWTKESDGGLNKLFQELTVGGVLEGGPEGGALGQAQRNMERYADIADEEGVDLLAYEGGQHLVGFRGIESNQAITNLFIAANRDQRMGMIYKDYLEKWFDSGGGLFSNFSDISRPSKWGSWGSLESVYQDGSPKYDAVVDFIKNYSPTDVTDITDITDVTDDLTDTDTPIQNQIIGEVGKVSNFNHLSQTIEFENSYENPVVFASPLSRNGGDAAIARITDIQNDSFTAFLQEAEYKNGVHTNESFSYIVLEAGSWKLSDGSLLEVGAINSDLVTKSGWENISFQNSFNNTPVVLSQIQTMNDEQFVRTRQKDAQVNGFSLTMEEEEALKNSGHDSEKIGWLAIESGQGSWGDIAYQAGHTGDEVTDRWHTIDFDEEFADSPNLFASIASYDGADSSGLRTRNINSRQGQIMIEEDRSQDSETGHTTETVDFLAIADSGNLIASAYDSDVFV